MTSKGVTGIGGVFFKTKDPKSTKDWYARHLGVPAGDFGHPFLWREHTQSESVGYTVWSPFAEDTSYFDPSDQSFMINYRVADLRGLIDDLKAAGVTIAGGIDEEPNGLFAWIVDPEGRKIELWQPVPSADDPYLE